MNQRIEPQLGGSMEKEVSNEINNFLKLAEEQANINSKIIETLSSANINRETKQQMIDILSEGAKNSSFFREIAKEKTREVDLGHYLNIPTRKKIADKFHKFKNMVIGFHSQINPSIVFKNPAQPDWYEVGHKVGVLVNTATSSSKTAYVNIIQFLKNTAESVNVLYKQAEQTTDKIHSKFYLIGEKKNVKRLEKKFSKIFDMLGLNTKEVLHTSSLTENLSKSELLNRIVPVFEEKFSAVKNDEKSSYSFSVLDDLSPSLKIDLIKTLIWPKINSSFKEALTAVDSIQEVKNDNKFIDMVINFARENNFNPDLVIHSLKTNPELIADYPGFKKIFINRMQILENADKFGKIVENNLVYIKELINVTEDLKTSINELNVPDEQKTSLLDAIKNSIVISKKDGSITFEQITKNLLQAEQTKEKQIIPKN